MIELASRRAPTAQFRHQSFLDAMLPSCAAVTAIGEIFNYLFDKRNTLVRIEKQFHRVFDALVPGGLFVFDAALVGRVPEGKRRSYSEGADWACLYEAEEDRRRRTLVRRISTFRKVGQYYRRDQEVHHLRLYRRGELMACARRAGFRVTTTTHYGEFALPPAYVAFIARKPKH
jgi:hypothetical protein